MIWVVEDFPGDCAVRQQKNYFPLVTVFDPRRIPIVPSGQTP